MQGGDSDSSKFKILKISLVKKVTANCKWAASIALFVFSIADSALANTFQKLMGYDGRFTIGSSHRGTTIDERRLESSVGVDARGEGTPNWTADMLVLIAEFVNDPIA